MHYTEGDGKLFDPTAGHNIYADEDPPTRDATQFTHESANALTEEIANVIKSTGVSLNASSETIAQMTQLKTAIDKKDQDVTDALEAIIDALDTDDIADQSDYGESTLTAALNKSREDHNENQGEITTLANYLYALGSDEVENDSGIAGSTVTDALVTLVTMISNLAGSDITNDSTVGGGTITDALETLDGLIVDSYSKTESDAKYSLKELEYKTDTVALFGTGSFGSGEEADIDVGTLMGWTTLNTDDIAEVLRRGSVGSPWLTGSTARVQIHAVVKDSSTITVTGYSNPSFLRNANQLVTIRVRRKIT